MVKKISEMINYEDKKPNVSGYYLVYRPELDPSLSVGEYSAHFEAWVVGGHPARQGTDWAVDKWCDLPEDD